MNSKQRGDITVAKILAICLTKGWHVLLPFGDTLRYDLVLERQGIFERIQCKTGWLRDGVIRFAASSSSLHRKDGKRKSYRGQIELFGVYCPDNQKTYLIPVNDVGRTEGTLRVRASRNKQHAHIRWAEKYEI
jgi:hypothetical protein